MTLVAGIDSSTQSCKVVVREAATGRLARSGSAPHPPGTEVDPQAWWEALQTAVDQAGGLADVEAVSVAAQQHGLVALDVDGQVLRPALLWNDLRSASAATDLIAEVGDGDPEVGARRWASAVGSVPTASFTVTKLRWLVDHEPDLVHRLAAVALPHDWLTWKLAGGAGLGSLVTDRSDASGTGYFDAVENIYRRDLLGRAVRGADPGGIVVPRVLAPGESAGRGATELGLGHLTLGSGMGDNAGAALGLGLHAGQAMLSLGTSGVVGAVAERPTSDATGLVAGFADGTGRFLNLAVTLNAARILDATVDLLEIDHRQFDELALLADSGAGGLVYVPYLEGERTPNLPDATGLLHGMTLGSLTRQNLARATVEGLLCHMADAMDAVRAQGVDVQAVTMVGGAAQSRAVRALAPAILGVPVTVPPPSEYVADGAARQAAWALSGEAEPPAWQLQDTDVLAADPAPEVRERYREVAGLAG